jgi:hypothetical protein
LGEGRSRRLPDAAEILTSAFCESARPGVLFVAEATVPVGPEASNHAKGEVLLSSGVHRRLVLSAAPACLARRAQGPLVRSPAAQNRTGAHAAQ